MDRLLELGGLQARSRWIDLPALRLHYLEIGEGDPVVLIHGAGGGAANWFRIMGPLAASSRILSPDLPGFGLSDPIEPRRPLGKQVAEVLWEWLQAIAVERFDLAGTSFGGLVALRLAEAAPNHIRRMVLLDSVGLGRELPVPVRLAATPVLGRYLLRPSPRGTRWVLRNLMTSSGKGLEGDVEDALVDYLWRSAEVGDLRVLSRAYGHFVGWTGQREILTDEELGHLAMPVLVLWGARDRFLPPSHGARAAARIPRSVLHLIPDAGHSPNWETPGGVAELISHFLATERQRSS